MRYGFKVICSDSAAFGICENLKVDFLLFHVAEGNMEAVFHFSFGLVDKNAMTLGFVVVFIEKIVY